MTALRLVQAPLWLIAVLALACEADLETECVGDCSPYQPNPLPSDLECYQTCVVDAPSGNVGELPCAVDAVLNNCRRCHTNPPENGAPFPLVTYDDTQQLYSGRAIWARMNAVITADFMPAEPPLLTETEKTQLLDDWACRCAPPRPNGETCP